MGGAARPLHDPGNHRSVERGSNPHTARCGSLRRPAKPAGERENDAALTPTLGARSDNPAPLALAELWFGAASVPELIGEDGQLGPCILRKRHDRRERPICSRSLLPRLSFCCISAT